MNGEGELAREDEGRDFEWSRDDGSCQRKREEGEGLENEVSQCNVDAFRLGSQLHGFSQV